MSEKISIGERAVRITGAFSVFGISPSESSELAGIDPCYFREILGGSDSPGKDQWVALDALEAALKKTVDRKLCALSRIVLMGAEAPGILEAIQPSAAILAKLLTEELDRQREQAWPRRLSAAEIAAYLDRHDEELSKIIADEEAERKSVEHCGWGSLPIPTPPAGE